MFQKSENNPKKSQENAKSIAISALSLLVSDENRLMNFIESSGIDVGELRELAQTNEFLCAVLEYFLSDEKYLLEFCAAENLKPETVQRATRDLGGGLWERDTP